MKKYTSVKSMSAAYYTVTNTYTCLKKSKILILIFGNTYTTSGYVTINDNNIFNYSGTLSHKFMKEYDVEPGDVIKFNFNGGGSSNVFIHACMYYENGAFE